MTFSLLAVTFAAAACMLLLLNRVAKAKHISEVLLTEYGKLLKEARERLRANLTAADADDDVIIETTKSRDDFTSAP